jgi:hypothetical protein
MKYEQNLTKIAILWSFIKWVLNIPIYSTLTGTKSKTCNEAGSIWSFLISEVEICQTIVNIVNSYVLANRKAPYTDSLFWLTAKARNQALMTPFMTKVIFNQGNELYRLCNRDKQYTTYHMLSASSNS